jgi:hypothetical protein
MGVSCAKTGQGEVAVTGKSRIMIYGPKDDGTYVVEFRQRIRAGLKRAVAQGVKLGRPRSTARPNGRCEGCSRRVWGFLKVAKSLGIGTGTVQRISGERAMGLRGAEQ